MALAEQLPPDAMVTLKMHLAEKGGGGRGGGELGGGLGVVETHNTCKDDTHKFSFQKLLRTRSSCKTS